MSPPFRKDATQTKTALLASARPNSSAQEAPISNQARMLLDEATLLFESTFGVSSDDSDDDKSFPWYCSMAPGRVNLIGEHVDYTGGFVFPMAIGYGTLCYGRGKLVRKSSRSDGMGAVRECRVISSMQKDAVSFCPVIADGEVSSLETYDLKSPHAWANYVIGVVNNYLPDLSSLDLVFCFDVAIAGDVPLGSGLSSSASLEVSVARFLECILDAHRDNELAFSSSQDAMLKYDGDADKGRAIQRALRCQHAERTYCGTPCGIMDQFVSSAAKQGSVLLIDCESVDYEEVTIGGDADAQPPTAAEDLPVVIVCNSNVKHDNAGGEYPIRVKQCDDALTALQAVDPDITSLRKATLSNVEAAKSQIDDVTYRRAKHVVTENERTLQAKTALSTGDFATMGQLMNASHKSMKDDYEVSCREIDILVELAQGYNGVYGSRLTGGGFGGCTVSLVQRTAAEGFMTYLKAEYKKNTNLECTSFQTMPEGGARSIPLEPFH
eukprot:CAMPEP_0195521690 /NCGR_PEP_ID=MMETSP0794_2-20130614/19174_1 /TAXON_ID=515487 /ORGANISM="Stephanopyxis turris, Strain CCMP 815" /LENGTH=495 /DNA_ID=CAMNT_0040651299 /DNA_START=208 /DNA_END=1695 /DNA_ORIENTATION=+